MIGITERGDAGINLAWSQKLCTVNGAVLITKNITKNFRNEVLKKYSEGHKLIVHCTCTGYGHTPLEPNVPNYKEQLNNLKELIDMGFPADRCVLRIDPIFPTEKGLNRVKETLNYFMSLNTRVTRIRVSIVDEYKHVKKRYRQLGWNPIYGDAFGPSVEQIKAVADVLAQFPQYTFETCAENKLADITANCRVQGCISNVDLWLMGLSEVNLSENPQNRVDCHCLSCKTELLTERKQCPHQCVYCFWKQ